VTVTEIDCICSCTPCESLDAVWAAITLPLL
jgi:hypothetical protein